MRYQLTSIYNSFLIYCVYVGILCYAVCIEVIRHIVEVSPSITWQQAPLPTETSHQPTFRRVTCSELYCMISSSYKGGSMV